MKLIDPFGEEESADDRLHNLETLWFSTEEEEWLAQKVETMV
jgi:hypothetical protein